MRRHERNLARYRRRCPPGDVLRGAHVGYGVARASDGDGDARNVSTALDLAKVFEKMPAGGTEYRLRCVMCYYGEHYAAFAVSDAGAGGRERWLLFDDATTKEVGGWEDVVASCEKGRLQPCVPVLSPSPQMKTRKPSGDGDERRRGRARAPGRGQSASAGTGTRRRRGEDVFGTRGRASRVSCSMLQ